MRDAVMQGLSLCPSIVFLEYRSSSHGAFHLLDQILSIMQALVVAPAERVVRVEEIAIPQCKPNELLVKVHAVALNKVDYLYTARPVAAQDRRVVGSDFAGTVAKVGDGIARIVYSRVAIGARVAGLVQGGMSELIQFEPQEISLLTSRSCFGQRAPGRLRRICGHRL